MPVGLPFKLSEAPDHSTEVLAAARTSDGEPRFGANATVTCVRFTDRIAAVKLYPADGRRRLDHEWQVVLGAGAALAGLAPTPLARSKPGQLPEYGIYEWLEGESLSSLDPMVAVQRILGYLSELHARSLPSAALPVSLLNIHSTISGPYGINAQMARLASSGDPLLPQLRRLLDAILRSGDEPDSGHRVICHTDSNPSNFLMTLHGLIAVDWDAGGAGSAAYELAELSTHPALPFESDEVWRIRLEKDYDGCELHFRHFRRSRAEMALWWAVRLIRQRSESTSAPAVRQDQSDRHIDALLSYLRSQYA